MTNGGRPPLARSGQGRVLGGVAAGLARYLGVEARVIRMAFVILLFFGGSGIWIYLIMWVVLPLDRSPAPSVAPTISKPQRDPAVRLLAGGILVIVGALWLINSLVPWLDNLAWPAALVAVGSAVIVYALRN